MNGAKRRLTSFPVANVLAFTLLLFLCGQSSHGQACNNGKASLTATSTTWKYITSPNYPNNYGNNENCEWELQASPGYRVIVSIVDVDVDCPYDELIINGEYNQLLVNTCDPNIEKSFVSPESVVQMVFTTDGSTTKTGFQIKYTAIAESYTACSWLPDNHHILAATEKHQYFSSKGYPISYQKTFQEEWLIIKPNATVPLGLRVTDSDLESSSKCRFDTVTVYNDACPYTAEIGEFCGTSTPSYTAKGSMYVLIRFSSDGTQQGRGFKVQYFLGEAKDDDDSSVQVRNILIGVFATIIVISIILGSGKLIARNCKRSRIRPKPLRNRRFMLESRTGNTTASSRPLIGQQTTAHPRARLITTLGPSEIMNPMPPVSTVGPPNIYSVSGSMNNRTNTSNPDVRTTPLPAAPPPAYPPTYNSIYGDNSNSYVDIPPPDELYTPPNDQFSPSTPVPMSPPPPYPGFSSTTNSNTAVTQSRKVTVPNLESSTTNRDNELKDDVLEGQHNT